MVRDVVCPPVPWPYWDLFEPPPSFAPVVNVVEVHPAVDDPGPLPLEENGGGVAASARKVGHDLKRKRYVTIKLFLIKVVL